MLRCCESVDQLKPTALTKTSKPDPADNKKGPRSVASAKPKLNASVSCDDYYIVAGGDSSLKFMRGRYNRGSASMSYNGDSIYVQSTGTPHYLYKDADGQWFVSDQASMKECNSTGWLYSAQSCACPGDCKAPSSCSSCTVASSHWAVGTWLEITGMSTSEQSCAADAFCPSTAWVH
jgi:hypothetical protein